MLSTMGWPASFVLVMLIVVVGRGIRYVLEHYSDNEICFKCGEKFGERLSDIETQERKSEL